MRPAADTLEGCAPQQALHGLVVLEHHGIDTKATKRGQHAVNLHEPHLAAACLFTQAAYVSRQVATPRPARADDMS